MKVWSILASLKQTLGSLVPCIPRTSKPGQDPSARGGENARLEGVPSAEEVGVHGLSESLQSGAKDEAAAHLCDPPYGVLRDEAASHHDAGRAVLQRPTERAVPQWSPNGVQRDSAWHRDAGRAVLQRHDVQRDSACHREPYGVQRDEAACHHDAGRAVLQRPTERAVPQWSPNGVQRDITCHRDAG